MNQSTPDKIIAAALSLVNENGYKGATTKAIAERAGVNEVTLFRHFGNKQGLMDAAIQKYGFADELQQTLQKEIVWDIDKDISMMATKYQTLLNNKRSIILLSIKEANHFPELDQLLKQLPQQYIQLLEQYFSKMMALDKIKQADPLTIATSFIFMNFGYFLLKTRANASGDEYSLNDFIEKNIKSFIASII